ncbi:MAG: PleD family two-component system response regulator [Alphaproteobacteria bacterium]|nr:PleD family two-component system response regulator [Alphaproteobacteria bacterium]
MPGRVLVVDDVLPNVKLLEAKLGAEYFDVLTATNGVEAVDVARQEKPDLILLDVMMPVMDGYEACERIKTDPSTQHIPVVMVTALSDISDRVRGLEAGADDFLTKPLSDVSLFARVRSFIRLKMMMDEWRLREETSDNFGMPNEPQRLIDVDTCQAQILVIEDNRIDSFNISDVLAADEHHVEFADSGETGQKMAFAKAYDLIVVSLNLKDVDALRLASTLRADDRVRHTPILMVSEDDEMERVAKGLDLGMNDYIVKPIDQNELMARVRTQIRRRRYQDRLRMNYERNLSLALTDELTKLYNRRYLEGHLASMMRRKAEDEAKASLVMLDLDRFKDVNDTHGHNVGDEVLKEVATRISNSVRNFDLVARLGGEEFVVLMPETGLETAEMVAERLRARIASDPYRINDTLNLTISASLGVTEIEASDSPREALHRADLAMYQAKRAGRDQVKVYSDEEKLAAGGLN